MSRIRADKFVNNAATGAPQLTFGAEVVAGVGLTGAGGINITGVATAVNFSGNITGTAATFSGNVSVGGTLTYEDVTNIDSIGVITARSGIRVGAGQSIGSDGAAVVYYGDGANLTNVGSAVSTTTLQIWLFGGG